MWEFTTGCKYFTSAATNKRLATRNKIHKHLVDLDNTTAIRFKSEKIVQLPLILHAKILTNIN